MSTTEKTPSKKWNEESTQELLEFVGQDSPVSGEMVVEAAEHMGVTTRSIASKLRKLGMEVASMAKDKQSAFSAQETEALTTFLNLNPNAFTYKEIAEEFEDGKFTAKQIQGKILALQQTTLVKPSEKVEVANKYTPEEEIKFIELANAGKFIEEIAEAFGKAVSSVRGKALSLQTKGLIAKIPAQRESHAKDSVDVVEALGDSIATMTVEEIAKATDKTERGIKTLLTRRGIKVANYDGAAKQAKARGKAEAEVAVESD